MKTKISSHSCIQCISSWFPNVLIHKKGKIWTVEIGKEEKVVRIKEILVFWIFMISELNILWWITEHTVMKNRLQLVGEWATFHSNRYG